MLYLSFLPPSLPAVGQEALGKATLSPPAPLLFPQLAHMLTIIYAVTSSSLSLVWMVSWNPLTISAVFPPMLLPVYFHVEVMFYVIKERMWKVGLRFVT